MEQTAHPDQFGFDRWSTERVIVCVVRSLKRAFSPSPGPWESPHFGATRNVFSRTNLELPSSTSVRNGKPFTLWFVGALDGSDTSRTQVTLDGFVD